MPVPPGANLQVAFSLP